MTDRQYLLINPPLTDPTVPYHSIPYLVGHARERGIHGETCIDANIESLNWLAEPCQVTSLLQEASARRTSIEAEYSMTRRIGLEYRTTLLAEGLTPESVATALTALRDKEDFFRFKPYSQSVHVLERWLGLLTLEGLPGAWSGVKVPAAGRINLSCLKDLSNRELLRTFTGPFSRYYSEILLPQLTRTNWRLIGLSVNYTSQLPFALHLLHRLRDAFPDTLICLGGTEISDVVKQSHSASVWRAVFSAADFLVTGEGESAFIELLAHSGLGPEAVIRNSSEDFSPNILPVRSPSDAPRAETPRYEPIRTESSWPAYDVWNWGAYWSPEPVVLYSPTRGCYWNKCTFCDYGLNTDRPTAPSRDVGVGRAVEDLQHIAKFARCVYFAVDAMSPAFLRKLCAALAERNMDVSWAAELRLEKSFPASRMGRLLREAGCVAISFGYESGSQRILDLIDKGYDLEMVPSILFELANADIGTQMMGFTGFPTETDSEAQETYEFLERHRGLWTTAAIGSFVLTPGAIVAKRPDRFGIQKVEPIAGQDIVRFVTWVADTERANDKGVTQPDTRNLVHVPFDRPWVGGIDTAHSILYYRKFGRRLVSKSELEGSPSPKVMTFESPWTEVGRFPCPKALGSLHDAARSERRLLSHDDVEQWLAVPLELMPQRKQYAMFPSGDFVELDFPLPTSAGAQSLLATMLRARGMA